ncbi:MAG: TetR family transcriptional regulator [Bacteroidota bacterium]|nr:TetR family transcriptional regulator [Bacteroidota bacterium]
MPKKNTEEKILDAARKLFMKNGMSGTRMQEIADEAKINKALLHYYYRSKEKLFERIFNEAFSQLFPKISLFADKEKTLEERVQLFVNEYINLLQKNPYLPNFIFQEIQRDSNNLHEMFKAAGFNSEYILDNLQKGFDIPKSKVRSLMINIIALCVFPFAAKPLLQHVFFENNELALNDFLEERKKELPKFIVNSIRK